ncbi:Rpn family recombination-promoting nuclease/putative transposase [Bacteroides stercorirosoris]|uniref:Rpn family recombination-promoting nuclease/putative transposase n=1 Tax=Bacteroides stercorirosoris TaxID=871324 RepID=A0A413H2G3_9BACE|nr:Rpn family recombination-promoting nuclease/putative transposase [Bacteroides stercorirosoris]RGX77658.1 Rpn family recombination-promoting nuclease/putative transposase [Bacteroides stercorirosoris]
MGRFINPFTDYGFKKIFGQEISKDLLIDFLNDLLKGERVITDLTFLNNEQLPEWEDARALIYDIHCTTDTGETIIVEMQNKSQLYFKERALFYLSHAVARQGQVGSEWRFDVKAVYGVFFMNFLLNDNVKLRTDVILADRDTGELFTDKMRQIFLALPVFGKDEEECENDFERWIYILKNMETLKRMPFKARKAVFEKLEEIADVASLNEEEHELYWKSVNAYRTHLCVMDAAKLEGREEGRAEGREEGSIEKCFSIARNLKQLGTSADLISKATGLTPEEIAGL